MKNNHDKIKVIYIAPFGHSGSTLLDLALNMHKEVYSVGEVMFLDKWKEEDLLCTCSKRIKNCDFWKEVFQKLNKGFELKGEISNAFENLTPIFLRNQAQMDEYAQKTYLLFKTVQEVTGARYILDSSKVIGRLKILAESNLFDLSVIHLVRNGEAVAKSYKTSKIMPSFHEERRTKASPVWKTTLKWYLSNKNLVRIKKKYQLNLLEVRFEDFTGFPEFGVRKICDFLNINFTKKMLNITTDTAHNISGSRWRYQDNIEIDKGRDRNESLSGLDKITFDLIAGNMNTEFGY